MSTSDEFKSLGNKAFANKDFKGAVDLFTKAIEVSPTENHVLFSNRSGAHASLEEYDAALKDAEKCIAINPSWAKGYNRLAVAEMGLANFEKAKEAYEKTLSIDPNNATAKDGLVQVEKALNASSNFDQQNLIAKLLANPKTAAYLNDPEFLKKVQAIQKNPQSLNPQELFNDKRMMDVFSVMFGMDAGASPAAGSENSYNKPEEAKSEKPAKKFEEPVKNNPIQEEATKTSTKQESNKVKADKLKADANALYKQKKFDEAIALYNEAWEANKDITYLNNRAAAEYEKGDYETALKTCEYSIEEGREMRADYKSIAKSFARIGTIYLKQGDLKQAVNFFNKSLTEHRSPDVLTKLRNAEKALKQKEVEEYVNPEKAEEARLAGRDAFLKGDWPEAVKSYTEMIKRSPDDARGYSNRATAYIKLMSFPDAVRDCESAISKDKNFLKAYIKKATAQLAMREFSNCIDTLEEAKVVDAETNEGKSSGEIAQLYQKAMSQRFSKLEGETEEQAKQRFQQDPEVQRVISDPVMQNILQQASTNPAALNEHMKNPEIYKKINLLIAAGIIGLR